MTANRPFDARFQLLRDRNSEASDWSTVSLVTALREYLYREPSSVFPPCAEHAELLTRCATELTDRGLDAASLIRYGLTPEVLGGILGCAVQEWIDPGHPADPACSLARRWVQLLEPRFTSAGVTQEAIQDPQRSVLQGLFTIIVTDLTPWVLSAPLDHLLSLEPPPEEDLDPLEPGEIDQALCEQYRWAVDRFSMTSLSDWALPSLHFELQWKVGVVAPPCDPALMIEPDIDRAALEAEIARRAVFPEAFEPHRQLRASLSSRMTRQAVGYLRDMKFEEAAALFRFAVAEDPNDAEAHNNLGFCLTPIDPKAARIHLERAVDLGFHLADLNLHNRVIATYLSNGASAALSLAETEWAGLPPIGTHATIWALLDDGQVTIDVGIARDQLAVLAAKLAGFGGNEALATEWQSRVAS